MLYPIVSTFEEACDVIEHLGILPLSSFIPKHPSLVSVTHDSAWHTGIETDPWLWRDLFAGEGVAAYGRFIAGYSSNADSATLNALKDFVRELLDCTSSNV